MRDTRYETGSALILAVVLVSLLAVVGVMFAMVARIDKMSTSAIAENKTLNLAVDTVIVKVSQELALDVPGPSQEYYDYPDADNAWLASLEPEVDDRGTPTPLDDIYYWQHISDIYYRFGPQDIQKLRANIIDDYQEPAKIGDSNGYTGDSNDLYFADADGDGVSDSMWVKLDNITSSKGRPIYAAVRIIDNGAMLNVNTGYKFDPCDPEIVHIDGSSQMQINLMALSWHPGDPCDWYDPNDETKLLNERANYGFGGINPLDLDEYKKNVVWRYNDPCGPYTPFDISDELEIRYRFLVNQEDIDTRLEPWGGEFRNSTLRTPAENLGDWFIRAYDDGMLDPNYSYRHIATTYNMDRIINPVGPTLNNGKMVNINNKLISAEDLYIALLASIDPNINPDMYIDDANRIRIKNQFAQLAANIVDFVDANIAVTVFEPCDPDIRPAYYGFDAQPFITEVGFIIDADPQAGQNYYAVELYNPFDSNIPLKDFELELKSVDSNAPSILPILFDACDVIPADGHFVIANDPGPFVIDTNDVKIGPQLAFFGGWQPPPSITPPPPTGPPTITPPSGSESGWKYNYTLYLTRKVGDPNDPDRIYVDRQLIDPANPNDEKYFERDVRDWRIVYQSLGDTLDPNGTLGSINTIEMGFPCSFFLPNPLAPPKEFITVGDIPRVLTIGHSDGLNNTIGEQLMSAASEGEIRLDLQNPNYSNIFQYLTVFDPTTDGIDNDGDGLGVVNVDSDELKVPGRININTAAWYVIAQLPWMRPDIAQYVASYRDTIGVDGFGSVGDLMQVNEMSYYVDGSDLTVFPDLTAGDDIIDDFEERDVIFSRISNLVTVRSDVFTAYILIRIGNDGPQKRAIAILDRSDVYPIPSGGYIGRVKARALHPVPDPR